MLNIINNFVKYLSLLKRIKMTNSYFLDTNIILDNFENLITLSDEGTNDIVISRTVLSELDSKKTIEGAIGYNAREFFRLMEKAEIVSKSDLNGHAKRIILKYNTGAFDITIHLVSLNQFDSNENNTDPKNLNDQKIIETAKKIFNDYENLRVVSNDIAFRSNAILDDLDCESFKTDNKKVSEMNFYRSFDAPSDGSFVLPCTMEDVQKLADLTENPDILNLCGIEICFDNGNKCYGYKQGNLFFEILDEDLKKQIITPIGSRQKVLSSLILSDTSDIVVCTSKAGGGKNLVVTSGCCALIDRKQSPYEGIVYVRSNIDSIETKDQELGFLPGDLDAKMGPYLRPLKDTVDTLVRSKYKVAISRDKEALDAKIEEFTKKYNITFEAMNFLRGGTIKNSLVIIDEAQNISVSGMKLILTRIGENCKVFILGDVAQIDSKYMNERNNGLTHMMNLIGTEQDIRIVGLDFNKTIRSKIAGWAADEL
jgi:PhoH-like ATPase